MLPTPRLLIPLTIQFNVRYILRTGLIDTLRQVCEPVFLLGWDDLALQNELTSAGFAVYHLPKAQTSVEFARLRKKIQFAHFRRIQSNSIGIDRRRHLLQLSPSQRIQAMVRNAVFDGMAAYPWNFENWLAEEEKQVHFETNLLEYLALIDEIKPDALFSVTPYFLEEELLIRAAASKRVKLMTAILSFDNLTTRPRIPVVFDKYMLWNEYNRKELLRIYPSVHPDKVEIVGSPQFDFYYNSSYLWNEADWRAHVGIPADRPVILFGSGPESITPVEPHIVAQLDEAIELNQFPNKPIILLRLHPVDTPSRWEFLRKTTKHIVFDLPWQLGKEISGKTNVTRFDIEKLASTLKFSQVHINTSSTMTLDGAIFDRPQIGPAYDDRPGRKYDRAMRELYLREHYLPITNSGGLQIAYSFEQLKEYILEGFQNPQLHCKAREKMVYDLCTYNDGDSTQRVANAVRDFLSQNGLH